MNNPPLTQQQQPLQQQQQGGGGLAPAQLLQATQLIRRNNPYLKGDLDTLDVLRAKLDPVGFEGYCIGMVHKRLHRAADAPFTDVQAKRRDWATGAWYLQQLIQTSFPHSTRSMANPQNGGGAGGPNVIHYEADDEADFRQLPDAMGRLDLGSRQQLQQQQQQQRRGNNNPAAAPAAGPAAVR
jgi:hypothetical protein